MNCTSFVSSLKSLSKVFRVQLDLDKQSTGNNQKRQVMSIDGARFGVFIVNLWSNDSSNHNAHKSEITEHSKNY